MDRTEFCSGIWDTMGGLYAVAGIAPLCLDLQDRFDADVPLLLFLVLADHAGFGAGEAEMQGLIASANDWRSLAVKPLRTLRIALKTRCEAPEDEAFRARIKTVELDAERREVARIVALFAGMAGPAGGLAALYLAWLGVPDADAAVALSNLTDGIS